MKVNRFIFPSLMITLMTMMIIECKDDKLSPNKTQTFKPVDAFVQNAKIGRGVNMGNALEAPNEGEWGVIIAKEYFDLIADAGFNNIRIPITWTTHALENEPYTLKLEFVKRIEWVVDNTLSKGLTAIINMHHYDEIFDDPDTHKDRFLAIWRQIAVHFKSYSENLIFEILNEPHGNLTSQKWNALLLEALAVIRESNPERNIIIGPVSWNNIDALTTLQLPDSDRHIIVTYHYYNPFNFTHQGADWVGEESNSWLGTKWLGTEQEKRAIQNDFDKAVRYSEENNRPIYMGEFGAYSAADSVSRGRWTNYVARSAEECSFSWSYWEFCAGFGVYDPEQHKWRKFLLDALIPPQEN